MKNIQLSTLSAKVILTGGLLCAAVFANAYPAISGPSRQNSNRSASYRVADTGWPTSDVLYATVYLTDNPLWNGKGTVWSVQINKPSGGWNAAVDWTWFIPGSAYNRTFGAKVVYRHTNGWDEVLNASNIQVATAGAAGSLSSVSLSTYSVKGGSNGTEPTLYVNLNGPAQVGGQWVSVQVNSNYAWCFAGFNGFWIPEGYTSGACHWFLGTKNVIFNQSANINAYVNGAQGIATLTIRKK